MNHAGEEAITAGMMAKSTESRALLEEIGHPTAAADSRKVHNRCVVIGMVVVKPSEDFTSVSIFSSESHFEILLVNRHLTGLDCCFCSNDDYDICLECVISGYTCFGNHKLHPTVYWPSQTVVPYR